MLMCENPNTDPNVIRASFNTSDEGQPFNGEALQIDFEHGQWFITHLPTGAQWSVNDSSDGFDFEQISEGDLDDWLLENHEHTYGPVEHARFTGNPHRKCLFVGCRHISLDLDDEECDDDE